MKSGPGTSLGDFNYYCLMLCKEMVSVWGGMHIGGDVEPGPIPVYPRGRRPPVPAQALHFGRCAQNGSGAARVVLLKCGETQPRPSW